MVDKVKIEDASEIVLRTNNVPHNYVSSFTVVLPLFNKLVPLSTSLRNNKSLHLPILNNLYLGNGWCKYLPSENLSNAWMLVAED